ncbi:hypothetical protein VPH35_010307 [Triticum aestivum]
MLGLVRKCILPTYSCPAPAGWEMMGWSKRKIHMRSLVVFLTLSASSGPQKRKKKLSASSPTAKSKWGAQALRLRRPSLRSLPSYSSTASLPPPPFLHSKRERVAWRRRRSTHEDSNYNGDGA